ncbi:MAG: hypothetical protein ACM37W_22930 [Actinomycetota bacterium]
MPDNSRVRLTVFMPRWVVRTGLKQLVAPLGVSMSQWVANMIEREILAAGYGPKRSDYKSIAEIVKENFETLSEETRIPPKQLQALQEGAKPSELDLVRIAAALDLSEDYMVELCHKSFPCSDKEKQPNGA